MFRIFGAILILGALIWALVFIAGMVKARKIAKNRVKTHEEAFQVAMDHLNQLYGTTPEDIRNLYRVEVEKFSEPIDRSLHHLKRDGSQVPTPPEQMIEYHVRLDPILLIFLGEEKLHIEIRLSINVAGEVSGSTMGNKSSIKSNDLNAGEGFETDLMKLTTEKLAIEKEVDQLLKDNHLGGISGLLRPGADIPLLIESDGNRLDISMEDTWNEVFRYTYDRKTKKFQEVEVDFMNVSPAPMPPGLGPDGPPLRGETKVMNDPIGLGKYAQEKNP